MRNEIIGKSNYFTNYPKSKIIFLKYKKQTMTINIHSQDNSGWPVPKFRFEVDFGTGMGCFLPGSLWYGYRNPDN